MVARQHDDIMICDIEKSPQAPKMYLCANFGCSTPDSVGGVCGQANRQKEI